MTPNTRAHVHALIDQLPLAQLAAIEKLLESIVDDEELTPADRAAIQAGLRSLDENGGFSMAEVLSDFGLTMDDFDKMASDR